jgi:hypothetical protein
MFSTGTNFSLKKRNENLKLRFESKRNNKKSSWAFTMQDLHEFTLLWDMKNLFVFIHFFALHNVLYFYAFCWQTSSKYIKSNGNKNDNNNVRGQWWRKQSDHENYFSFPLFCSPLKGWQQNAAKVFHLFSIHKSTSSTRVLLKKIHCKEGVKSVSKVFFHSVYLMYLLLTVFMLHTFFNYFQPSSDSDI